MVFCNAVAIGSGIFQFSDGEFSGPIVTSLKMWKKINSFIVTIALSVTLEKKPAASRLLGKGEFEQKFCKKYKQTDRQTCFYLGSYTKKVH